MNKTDLVSAVSAQIDLDRRTVAAVLDGLQDVVSVNVKKGEKVVITGFVSFERVDRKARTARNPRTGEPVKVKASKSPRVSAGAALKNVVNGKAPAPKLVTARSR